MPQNKVQQRFAYLRNAVLWQDFVNLFPLYLIVSLLLILIVYLFAQIFIFTLSLYFIYYLFLLSVFSLIFHFIFRQKHLFLKDWPLQTILALPIDLEAEKDALFNADDILKKSTYTDLELAYLNSININTQFPIKYSKKLVLINLFIGLSYLSLLLFNATFTNFMQRYLFPWQKIESNYTIEFIEKSVLAKLDSNVNLTFKHNIPSLNSLALINENSSGDLISRQSVNFLKNKIEFNYSGLKEGNIYLLAESNVLGELSSVKIPFKFLESLSVLKHTVRVYPPNYTKLNSYELSTLHDIHVLKGSRIEWTVNFNKKIKRLISNFAEKNLVFTKLIKSNEIFFLKAIDTDSLVFNYESDPIKIDYDHPPKIVQLAPKNVHNVVDDKDIFFYLNGYDDYGFTKVVLRYQTYNTLLDSRSSWKEKTVLNLSDKVFEKQIAWAISELDVFPGMDIYYQFIAFDNNVVDGAQTDSTQLSKIHILSAEEIFAELSQEQEKIQEAIGKNLNERREVLAKLEKLNKKLKQKGAQTFEEKKQTEQLLQRLEELNKNMQEQKDAVNKLEKKAEENKSFSEEMVKQFQELQKLLGELKLEKKQDTQSLNNEEKNQSEQNLDQVTQTEKNMQEEMSRIKELFEKLKEKQKNDQLIKNLDEFIKKQEKINELTNKDSQKLANAEQEKLSSEVKQLQKKEEQNALLNNIQKNLAKDKISDRMQETNKDQEITEQKEKREEIKKDLKEIKKQAEEEVKKADEKNKIELLNQLTQIINNLLQSSFSQETVVEELKVQSAFSQSFKYNLQAQQSIKEEILFLRRAGDKISKQSFLFNPKILDVLNVAVENVDKSLKFLSERDINSASLYQNESLGALNQSLLMLQTNRENMKNAKTALGEEEFQQKMQEMGQKQQGINKESQDLWEMLKKQSQDGKLSGKEKLGNKGSEQSGSNGSQGGESGQGKDGKNGESGSGGLGSKQSDLADELSEMLEQLNSGEGKESGGQGRNSEMLKEMKKISEELKLDRLNQDLINRQEKLVQKMLDASQSGKEKDKETKKREKEVAKEFVVKDVKDLDKELGQNSSDLQKKYEIIMNSTNEPELKKIIKNYFENLIKSQRDTINLSN